jgi:hypothetical protein
MMAALVAARIGFGAALSLGRQDLTFKIADNEIDRLERLASNHRVNPKLLVHLAAYVTLCQGLDRAGIIAATEAEKQALSLPGAGDPGEVADSLVLSGLAPT